MNNTQINNYLEIVKSIVKLSLFEIKKNQSLIEKFEKKSSHKEIKTSLDSYISNFIINKLLSTKIKCISEEKNYHFDPNETYWIIDPIDGTSNFQRGFLSSSVSIALYHNKKFIFGVVGIIPENIIYWGGKELGSYSEKKKLKVSNTHEIANSILASGFPTKFKFNAKNQNLIFKLFKKFSKIRMIGSASISLIYLSSGKIDAYFEKNIRLWDIAAGIAILEGAGGFYSLKFLSKRNLICELKATNGKINI